MGPIPQELEPSPLIFNEPKQGDVKTADSYGRYHPANLKQLKLESNFGPMTPESMGYLQPTSLDTPREIMRERYVKDGYLFVLPMSKFLPQCAN
jgi:phytanoyl-CoA hydroxylase